MTRAIIFGALFVLPVAVTVLAYYMLFHRGPAPSDAAEGLDRYNQVIRSIVTVSLLSGFLLLTWVGKIEPTIFGNTFSMILAFWFAKQMEQKNGGPKS